MSVTPFYAGILGLWLVLLSTRVLLLRRSARVSLGHSGNAELERRIRAQGNLAEYAPMGLILIGLLELSGLPHLLIHILCVSLVVGRLIHGWSLSFTAANSTGRVAGMILTLSSIVIAAILNVITAIS